MTREEAIWWVNHLFEIRKEEYFNKGMMKDAKEVEEAQRMAIEALQEPKTIIAIDPPYKNDKGLTMVFKGKDDKLILEEVKEIVAVVRCKDCKYFDGTCRSCSVHRTNIHGPFFWVSEYDFCSNGERKQMNVD